MKKLLTQIFKIKSSNFPWAKAITAGLCNGFPIIIGILAGRMDLGLISALGSFSYLYVFNEPYAFRIKKILSVAIGISLSVLLGTLTAAHPVIDALIVGVIGFTATVVFGVLKVQGPSAVFFVLTYLAATAMPIDRSQALLRFLLVLASGIFCWIMSMIGWFFNPYGPEKQAIKEIFLSLSEFSETIGTDDIKHARHRTVVALNNLEDTLLAGNITWKSSEKFNRLYALNEQANKIFLELLEIYAKHKGKIPKEISDSLKTFSTKISFKSTENVNIETFHNLPSYSILIKLIYETESIINGKALGNQIIVKNLNPSMPLKIKQSLNKDSIIFHNAVKYGIALTISAFTSFLFPFEKRYWITITCASVMLGTTIMTTFNRAVQRFLGTLAGIIITAFIFKFSPLNYSIAAISALLTTLTELFIVKNYALAAIFITPSALLTAEASLQIYDISRYIFPRITATGVGAIIGLFCSRFIGFRSKPKQFFKLMSKVITSQKQLILNLNKKDNATVDTLKSLNVNMQLELMNLNTAYTTALGEVFQNKDLLENMWSALYSISHLSYLLERLSYKEQFLSLHDKHLEIIVGTLDKLAFNIGNNESNEIDNIPLYQEAPQICIEINRLLEALRIENL